MKKQLLLWSMLICIFTIGNAQDVVFNDDNFKQALLDHINPIIDTDGDGEISIEEASAITLLNVSDKGISDLTGIEKFVNLEQLTASKNGLTSVDFTDNTKLIRLVVNQNNISLINISNNLNLDYLKISYNNLSSIDVSKNIDLRFLLISDNNLNLVDVSKNIELDFLSIDRNPLDNLDLSKNLILGGVSLRACYLNNLDVSSNTNLRTVDAGANNLTELNLINNILLTRLLIDGNDLNNINLLNNTDLSYLKITSNNLTELDLSKNDKLSFLDIANNKIEEINLSRQTELTYLGAYGRNNFTSLDVRDCSLTSLNIFGNSNLQTVFMRGQPIKYKTVLGEEKLDINLERCPSLQFICADQEYLNDIYSLLEDANQTDCLLSDNCAVPHNRIQGNITFDLDNDGCGDADDVPFNETLKFNAISLTDISNNITAYPNEDGQYTLHAADDTYFFVPVLENLNYFTINPPVSPLPTPIPLGLASLTTDYCIQPLGDFDDLEISIFPVSRAQPGFNATYLIRYKNIGTTVQSGSVTLDYQEDVLDYVSSTPIVDSDINGQLTWNFQDLSPMQTVEIPLTLILNTPMDSPALNGGEILNFTATITGAIDETPENNVMNLAQTVVNSYDPNDKTCLEGDILDPDDVGGYLHYLIRFENEGSAEARTIRVLDVIDTEKLDIETLMPLEGSHSYTTTITNGNEVEFTFSNINLPFDDANNDGYVLFKIKSLDTLVEGDDIVNSAAIYFDFNFPIITEDSVVKVEREVVEAGGFSDYFTLSPNPTTGIMNLKVLDESIAITYILLYDIGGNLVGYYPGTTRTMNVSYLFPNSYFMKIYTDKGELTTQFIKL